MKKQRGGPCFGCGVTLERGMMICGSCREEAKKNKSAITRGHSRKGRINA